MIRAISWPKTQMSACLLVFFGIPLLVWAQSSPATPKHAKHRDSSSPEPALTDQLRDLQAKVAKLEAALKQKHQGQATSDSPHASAPSKQDAESKEMGMKKMGSMKTMGMMSGKGMGTGMMGNKGMGMTSGNGMGMMSGKGMGMGMMSGMKKEQKGMRMMGQMQGMGSMNMPSALPGFPGASHIYHIGATSFFLDHPEHITLTPEQQKKLNSLKEKALLEQGTFDRKVAQAEQELWVLTSADAPDAAKIESKIREITKLQGDQRIAFIQAVGEAAKVLTQEQRSTLVGTLPQSHSAPETKTQP